MDLVVRPMEAGDIPVCAALLRGHLAYPDAMLADVTAAWSNLLADEAFEAVVTEDRDRGDGAPLGFAGAIFVDGAWLAAAARDAEPYLSVRTLQTELEGRTSPILRPDAIESANAADGLDVLVLHYVEARGLSETDATALRFRTMGAFLESFRGYRIRDVVQEFWDEIDIPYIVEGWGRERADFSAWYAKRDEALPLPGRRPYLIGLFRDEALSSPGNIMASLFVHEPARFILLRGGEAAAARGGERAHRRQYCGASGPRPVHNQVAVAKHLRARRARRAGPNFRAHPG